MDYNKESLALHKAHKGKLEVVGKVPVKNRDDLSLAYTRRGGALPRHRQGPGRGV